MSYNVDTIDYISGKLYIERGKALVLSLEHKDDVPEGNLFDALDLDHTKDQKEKLPIERVRWCSEGSGSSFDTFKEILKATTGDADLLVVWEGGDSITGLRVRNGKVEEAKVKHVLED